MSQYSEMMGSFIRTGDYPMEAHYIFESQQDLIDFYNDPINRTTLHVGLFRIVQGKTKDEQALYWVVPDADGFLYFEKLVDYKTVNNIEELRELLNLEIKDRKLADSAIWGTIDTTEINTDLNSILKLSEAILDFRDALEKESEKSDLIKKELKATVGTEEDDIITYLNSLDYTSLTNVSETLNKFLNTIDDSDNTINTLPELQKFLEGFEYTHNLYDCFKDLWNIIQGTPTPNNEFRTLRGIQDFIETLASAYKNRTDNLLTELDQTQVGVGLSGDGAYNADQETYYLKNATSVMNALKTLDSLINEAINNCNIQAKNTSTVDIDIIKETDKTTISANVILSSNVGNDIQSLENGLYHNIDSEYENGILTIKVNGNIRQQHVLGLSSIVDKAYYDPDQESIIITFKLQDGNTQTIDIPVSALIQEWIIDNSYANKVVELTKERVVAGGADKLSADVRLSSNKYNILEKEGNTLLVKGLADNIVYNGDVTVKSKLDSLTDLNANLNDQVSDLNNKLDSEITRAQNAETALDNKYKQEIADSLELIEDLTTAVDNEIQRSIAKDNELDAAIKAESNRSIAAETQLNQDLRDEIQRSTNADSRHDDSIVQLNSNLSNLNTKVDNEVSRAIEKENEISNNLLKETDRAVTAENLLLNNIAIEVTRATNAETLLDHKIDDINTLVSNNQTLISEHTKLITDLEAKNLEQDSDLKILDDKVDLIKDNIESNINTKINTLQDALNQEISRSTSEDTDIRTKISELSTDIANETTRAKAEESVIRTEIDKETGRATQREDFIETRLSDHINDHNNPHQVTAEQINVYTKDQITSLLKDVSSDQNALSDKLTILITALEDDLDDHIHDYNNPHKVTKNQIGLDKVDNTSDLEKPISLLTQNALYTLESKINTKVDTSDLSDHIRDRSNPHAVTKEQVGLNNVDNTSDLDKPVSTATQRELDKKSDVSHTHSMADISDLENLPIVKGFVEAVTELPENANGGDKYILKTKVGSGNTAYTLYEYDGSNGIWKQKILTVGGVASVIDGDVWKLNSSGPERVLDVSDYTYFYNKIYDETKDLIEDIDWEENDETSDTNNQIRLKITYKTAYGDPNESEVVNPYQTKNVKYIDIDKARFLSNAYSRPAEQSDVDNGYAASVGEPLLILVMTTGDHVTISLKDVLNIYDPVNTPSVEMSVSDWTGDPNTSYKISSNVKIDSNSDNADAVSLHISNNGLYGTLQTSNTNSISLNSATGSSKTLTADLNINNSLNNNSDVLLTVDSSGLSAKLIWGEYE